MHPNMEVLVDKDGKPTAAALQLMLSNAKDPAKFAVLGAQATLQELFGTEVKKNA